MRSIQNLHSNVGGKLILDGLALDVPASNEDADARVAEGLAAMDRGDEIDQEELFASWRARYA